MENNIWIIAVLGFVALIGIFVRVAPSFGPFTLTKNTILAVLGLLVLTPLANAEQSSVTKDDFRKSIEVVSPKIVIPGNGPGLATIVALKFEGQISYGIQILTGREGGARWTSAFDSEGREFQLMPFQSKEVQGQIVNEAGVRLERDYLEHLAAGPIAWRIYGDTTERPTFALAPSMVAEFLQACDRAFK
jgi:hypothetical protein